MVTVSHAVWFARDMKLAHYVKIPQRQTFAVQMIATLINTFVSTLILNFQMNYIPGVCTKEARNRFTCPFVDSFFSSSVLWVTIGPRIVFGAGFYISLTLLVFPLGAA